MTLLGPLSHDMISSSFVAANRVNLNSNRPVTSGTEVGDTVTCLLVWVVEGGPRRRHPITQPAPAPNGSKALKIALWTLRGASGATLCGGQQPQLPHSGSCRLHVALNLRDWDRLVCQWSATLRFARSAMRPLRLLTAACSS